MEKILVFLLPLVVLLLYVTQPVSYSSPFSRLPPARGQSYIADTFTCKIASVIVIDKFNVHYLRNEQKYEFQKDVLLMFLEDSSNVYASGKYLMNQYNVVVTNKKIPLSTWDNICIKKMMAYHFPDINFFASVEIDFVKNRCEYANQLSPKVKLLCDNAKNYDSDKKFLIYDDVDTIFDLIGEHSNK
jgi:hypothetical protein